MLYLYLCSVSLHVFAQGDLPLMACTMDINVWGNSSSCLCSEKLVYSEVTGECMTSSEFDALGRQGIYPQVCTKDIGLWASPSHCLCPDDRTYSEESGSCLTQVTPRIVTVTGTFTVTKPAVNIGFAEIQLITPKGERYWLNFSRDQQSALNLDGLPVEIVGEVVYLRAPSLNSPAGTLITVNEIYWLD